MHPTINPAKQTAIKRVLQAEKMAKNLARAASQYHAPQRAVLTLKWGKS